jgi:hypothetical protein
LLRRILAVATTVAAVSAVAALVFGPAAKADPTGLAVDTNNGARTQVFTHPDHPDWWVQISVDTHRGYTQDDLTGDVYLSGAVSIIRGNGAKRVQVDAIRVAFGTTSYNDFFPNKVSRPRNNTPPGCRVGNNFYDDVSTEVGCQPGPDRLNSDADYPGNVTTVRGYSDWMVLVPCTSNANAATRGFLAVRWGDNSYSELSLRTVNVPADTG